MSKKKKQPPGKKRPEDAAARQRKREARRRRRRRRKETMTIFIGGKQKRVRRPPTIDGLSVDEFIRRNADPIWLHQNEMWEYMTPETDPYAVRFEEIEKRGASFDEYLEDLALWEDEADGCEGEAGFDEDESEPSSDGDADELPF